MKKTREEDTPGKKIKKDKTRFRLLSRIRERESKRELLTDETEDIED